jgi:hypothetical protein
MIHVSGVYTHKSLADLIKNLEAKGDEEHITYEDFYYYTAHLIFLRKVLDWELVIPHFQKFRESLQ